MEGGQPPPPPTTARPSTSRSGRRRSRPIGGEDRGRRQTRLQHTERRGGRTGAAFRRQGPQADRREPRHRGHRRMDPQKGIMLTIDGIEAALWAWMPGSSAATTRDRQVRQLVRRAGPVDRSRGPFRRSRVIGREGHLRVQGDTWLGWHGARKRRRRPM